MNKQHWRGTELGTESDWQNYVNKNLSDLGKRSKHYLYILGDEGDFADVDDVCGMMPTE